jgi:hypothetical protein
MYKHAQKFSSCPSEILRSLLPVLVKAGITTEAQVAIDSLHDRIRRELQAGGGVAVSPSLIGTWATVD